MQTKTQAELTPIEMVELPSEPSLENLTNQVDVAPPSAPAQVAPDASSPPIELATPQVLPPVPPQPVAPVILPSPIPSSTPTPTPTSIPASPVPTPVSPAPASASPTPSPPAVSPLPLPPAQPVSESPPTANVQSIEQALPTVLPGSETPTENPSASDPDLAPVAIDPEAIPAQVQMTVAIAGSPTLSESPVASPAVQRWVFEPNPMTSSCPAMTPSIVRQFGLLVTLQVDLGTDGQVLKIIPVNVSQDVADSVDYINFVQCILAERWQTEPSTSALNPPGGGLVVVDVMVEANDSGQ